MNFLDLVIVGLATFRLTSIIHVELIAKKIRQLAGQKEDKTYPNNFVGNLFDCFWCLSVWCGAAMYVTYFYITPILVWILAVSLFAILIDEVITQMRNTQE